MYQLALTAKTFEPLSFWERVAYAVQLVVTLQVAVVWSVPHYAVAAEGVLLGQVSLSGGAVAGSMSLEPESLPLYEGMLGVGDRVAVLAVAYSSEVGQTDSSPTVTASGRKVRSGIIAANFLPLGTVVSVNGRRYVVEDRMNSRYNGRRIIDIWMPSSQQAYEWGVKQVVLTVAALPR